MVGKGYMKLERSYYQKYTAVVYYEIHSFELGLFLYSDRLIL